MSALSNTRKWKGVVHDSVQVIHLATHLDTLECTCKADQPTTFALAQHMAKKLAKLDADFRKHYYRKRRNFRGHSILWVKFSIKFKLLWVRVAQLNFQLN